MDHFAVLQPLFLGSYGQGYFQRIGLLRQLVSAFKPEHIAQGIQQREESFQWGEAEAAAALALQEKQANCDCW